MLCAWASTARPYVPILFATSPFAAMRSAPTITTSTFPRLMRWPAELSVMSVTGILSRISSQAVRRAPCRYGRVSLAITETRLPASRAERTTPSAVPCPAVASAPVLQWVRMRAPSGTCFAPARPMAWLVSRSARKISSAVPASRAAAAFGSPRCAASSERMRSSAQKRFTAVGRLVASASNAASIAAENSARVRCCSRCASSAMPNAAAQPITGAPRTTIERMASATSAALAQLAYSRRAGRARWSISSRRPSRQRRASTADASDNAFIAAVDRHLRAGGLGEKRPAHLRRQLRDVAAAHRGLEHVVGLVLLHRHRVLLRALGENLLGPKAGIEHCVGMDGVDAYPVSAPFERGDARELIERRLGSGISGGARTRRRNVFRADHHHPAAARGELQERIADAHQDEVRVEVDGHRAAPFVGGQIGDPAARRKNAGV